MDCKKWEISHEGRRGVGTGITWTVLGEFHKSFVTGLSILSINFFQAPDYSDACEDHALIALNGDGFSGFLTKPVSDANSSRLTCATCAR